MTNIKEFEQWVKDYNSDSKSKTEDAEGKIVRFCRAYINKLEDAYHKASYRSYDDVNGSFFNEYRKDSGCLSIDSIDMGERQIVLSYSDRWAYGGECGEIAEFSFDELTKDGSMQKSLEIYRKALNRTKDDISSTRSRLKALEKKASNLKRLIKNTK